MIRFAPLGIFLLLALSACTTIGLPESETKAQSLVYADHGFQASVETAEVYIDQGKITGLAASALATGTAAANAALNSQWRQIFPEPGAGGGDILDDILEQGRALLPILAIGDRHRAAATALIEQAQAEGRDISEAEMLALVEARGEIVERVVIKLEAAAAR